MRIECPNCAAAYQVPDHLVVPGRATRCARCATSWVPLPMPAAHDAAIPAPAIPEPAIPKPAIPASATPDPAPATPPAPPVPLAMPVGLDTGAESHGGPLVAMGPRAAHPAAPLLLWAAWVASLAMVLTLLAVIGFDRAAIGAAWPPMQRLYALLGLG